MKPTPTDPEHLRHCLSELMDGEADAAAASQACSAWAQDASNREAWHVYHLIGDVLRSDELAAGAAHDQAFHARFRTRLAAEPVVLAPPPPTVAREPRARARWRWATPVALAASVVAVAGVVVVARQASQPVDATVPTLAALSTPPSVLARASAAAEGRMLRDARVDEYLRAHRAMLAGSPAALPGGAMRNVDLVVPPR